MPRSTSCWARRTPITSARDHKGHPAGDRKARASSPPTRMRRDLLRVASVPACGAMASARVETASGKAPFFVGKPNPLMMRTALNYLGVHSEDTIMVGDRMDTDIVAGVESGMETILVLTGVTMRTDIEQFPYRPHHELGRGYRAVGTFREAGFPEGKSGIIPQTQSATHARSRPHRRAPSGYGRSMLSQSWGGLPASATPARPRARRFGR